MSRLSLKSIGLGVFAVALAFAFTPNAVAAEFNGQVNVVANPNATPQITAKVDAAKLAALKMNELPDSARDLGRMDGNQTLTLELRLARTHVAQSAALALRRQVQDPTSPWYGKTLTPAEFAENFGLAGSDLDTLTNWLKAQGFEVGAVDNGRMVIGFSGTVAQVDEAFHTEMRNYAAKDGSPRFAPAMAPQIPYAFHAVVGNVAGLENFRDYRAATFPGPVTDFIPGTTNQMATVETSGTSTPNLEGELLHDSSFTISSPAIGIGGHAILNVRLGGNTHPATGSLTIVDESTGETVAHIADITACTGYNSGYGRSCTVDFAPTGAGTDFLKAIYSGDEHERGTVIGYNVISHVGTQANYSTVTISSAVSTYMVYPGAGNTTFASNIYYAGAAGTAASAATGTYSLDYYDINSTETVIVAAANLTGCTTTTATHNVSCSNAISGSTLSSDSTATGLMQMDVVYSGDANYASTSNGLFGYDGTSSSATFPTSITLAGSFTTTHTYGASASDSGLTGLTLVSAASPVAGYSACDSIDNILGNAQVGLLAAFENASTVSKLSYAISFTEPAVTGIPAQLTPGTYAVSALYTGDRSATLSASCTYGPFASATSVTLTEAKQAPTAAMTSPTAAAPTSQLVGALSAFTVTGTLAWTGTGITPTPANLSFTSTAGGAFGTVTCTAANSSTTFPTSPYTCSATFTPTGTDTAGSYNINLGFTTDTNYAAASTTVTGNYTITNPVTPTLALTPSPVTSLYGATLPTPAVTTTVTGQSSNGSSAGIVVTVTANATYGSLSTTNGASSGSSSVTCTTATTTSPNSACVVYFVPNGTTAVGTYSSVFSATSAASSNGLYNAVTTPVTSNLQITQQTPTVAVTSVVPNTEAYGSATTSTVTATLAWVGAGAAPTGSTLSFTSSAGGTFTGESCSGATSPITCTATFTPTATDAVGSYYIEATYAGDTNYATANSGTTSNFTITKQTPTFGTMSFSPAATEPYGTSQIITISDTLNYTGSGNAPTGAVKFVLNAVSYTATCSAAPSPLTCTANVPAATIAALPVNTYTVTATYTTDTNYAAATGTSGTFTITGATSTLALTPNPVSSVYGSVTGIVITATATGSAGTPTGTVSFSGAYATYGTLSATTCTLASGACTVTFTPNGTTAVGTGYAFLSATVAANGNYLASNTATDTLNITIASPTLTFSPSPIVSLSGSVTGISVTVTASPAVPGTVAFTGTYATYGTLSATSCTLASGSCSVTFTPNGTTAAGTYSNILTGTLPSNSNYNTATANDSLVIAASGQYAALAVTTTPIAYFGALGSGSITAVLSWINPAVTPSGTITFTDTTASRTFGVITLSPTGAAIASTGCTTAGSIGTCTYTCSAMVDLAVSCTLTNTKASGTNTTTSVADTADGNAVTASYSGNSFFSTATGNAYLYNQYEYTAVGGAATIALSGTAIANSTYGLTKAESPTVSITGASSDPPSDSTFPFLDITSTGQTGTMYEINLQTCTTNPCVTATSWTFPAVVAPGTYSLSYNYSGDYQSAAGETDQTTLTTGSVVVAKGTTTMGTMTFSPAATEPYATSQAITISDTLTYLGIGEAPQGAVTYTLNSVGYVATCGAAAVTGSGNTQSNVETCTATVPAATIAALAVNTYTVTAGYTTDTNYLAATGTSGTFTIAKATVTPAMTSVTPTNQIYGSATALSVAGTISWTGSGTAPTVGDITFTSTDAGSFTGLSCTGSSSPYSCTATFTPTGTDVIGYQAINISFSGDTNYTAAATTIPGTVGTLGTTYNFLINRQTMTFGAGSVTPDSVVFATSTAVALSQVVNYTGSGNQPGTSGFNFTLNGVTYTPSCTTAVSDSFTCTYTVAGSVIAALPIGSYPVTFNFPTAGNYNTATQSVDTLTITGATPTTATISAVSAPFGSTTPVNITVNESGSAGVVTGGVVTFSVNSPATGSFNHSTCTLNSSGNCTVQETFIPTGTLAVGVYSSIQASFAAVGNYAAATATNTETITSATATLAIAAGTPGTNTAGGGIISTTLNATLTPHVAGSTVTFTDVTRATVVGTATTGSNGVASITVNTSNTGSGQTALPAGGINAFSASATATSNTNAANTTANATTYFQGLLFSSVTTHNFSGGLTGAADPYSCCAEVEGTVDGTTGVAYGVTIYNFTSSAQPIAFNITQPPSNAFTVSNGCPSTLNAGNDCTITFNYAPPDGDGCTPIAYPATPTGIECTYDGAHYPQGTYESAPWNVTLPSGVVSGVGNYPAPLTRSGPGNGGTLAGKALLEPLSLTVSPLTANFGSVAQGTTSSTITVVVTNSNSSAVVFGYTAPTSGDFTVTSNTCSSPLGANSSCNIYLTMVTSAAGSFTDSLKISPSAGAITVAISGTVTAPTAGITLSSNQHNFGSVTDGTSVGFSTTLTNNTSGTASLSFSNSAGTGYTTSTNCGTTLAASATCTYGFTFAPTTAGASTDTLTITSNVPILPGSGGDTGTVTASGTGVSGGNLTATSVTHNWGTLAVGTSGGSYGVEITNSTGSAVTLSFSGLTGGSSGFTLVGENCPASLAANSGCELVFSFTPTATGPVTGTYPITSSSPLYSGGNQVSPSQITLEGTGD